MSAIAVGAAPPAAPSVAGAPSGVHVERKEISSDGIVAESSEIVATLLAWACNKVVPAALDDAAVGEETRVDVRGPRAVARDDAARVRRSATTSLRV